MQNNFSQFSSLESSSNSKQIVDNESSITYILKDIQINEEKSRTEMQFYQFKIPVENNFILLKSLISILKEKMNYILSNEFLIYVYNDLKGDYMLIGSDPLLFPVRLPVNEFRNSTNIYLKFHSKDIIKKVKKRNMKNEKRLKERGIEEVNNLITTWRNTHKNMKGKINLEQIANDLNVSRKTLDDYSLQIKKARQYGFNFEMNKNKKMGFLRSFVKFHIQQEKINQKTLPQHITIENNISQDINLNDKQSNYFQFWNQIEIEKNNIQEQQEETRYLSNNFFEPQYEYGSIDIFFSDAN